MGSRGLFVLPVVLMILAVLNVSIVVSLFASDGDFSRLKSRRLTITRDTMAINIRSYASMASALRNSVISKTNPLLEACVGSISCTPGGPYPLNLSEPVYSAKPVFVGGPAPNGVQYDMWGNLCTASLSQQSFECPISVITQFSIVCPAGQNPCSSNLALIQVSYTVQKTPGSSYPGILSPISTPSSTQVPVPCIVYQGAKALGDGIPSGCY